MGTKSSHHKSEENSGSHSTTNPEKHETRSYTQHHYATATALLTLFEKLELTADVANEYPGELSRSTFEDAFHGPLHKFGKLMYLQMVTSSTATDRERITREQFVKAGTEILQMYDEKHHIKYYFHLFASGKDYLTVEDAKNLFEISFALTLSLSQILYKEDERDGTIFAAMTTGLFGVHTETGLAVFQQWVKESCPHLFHSVHNWVTHIMTGKALPQEMEMARVPQLEDVAGRDHGTSMATLWLLSITLPPTFIKQKEQKLNMPGIAQHTSLGASCDPMLTSMLLLRKMARLLQCQSWTLLYSSSDHGMSINRFNNHVSSYHAPNVSFIGFEGGNLFCLAVDQGWKEGPNKFGGQDCRTIQILPVFRVVQGGAKMVRWTEYTRDIPQGIHVGCDGQPRVLYIPKGFDKIQHYGVPCDLLKLEVWGCGTEDSLEAQKRQKKWEAGAIQREQGKKLRLHGETWQDSPDKQLLQWGGVNVGNNSYNR